MALVTTGVGDAALVNATKAIGLNDRNPYNYNGGFQTTPVVAGNSGEQSSDDFSLDISGYDQAGWDLEKTKELLEEQRAFNSAEAQKTRDWQERLSNTAYQRAVQDLEAAGLNKWLAVTGGNGASASTPSGASASSSSGDASTPNPILAKSLIQAVTSVINSAFGVLGNIVPRIKI